MDQRLTLAHVAADIGIGFARTLAFPLARRALAKVPRGDGHPVLVLPGFLTSDPLTRPLRKFLSRIGYRSYPWKLGVNMGYSFRYDIEDLIVQRIRKVLADSGSATLTLVGWSLGGVYAKSIAGKYPELVREVITLGSPITGDISHVSIYPAYHVLTHLRSGGSALIQRLREEAPPLTGVPITPIFSVLDGFVPVRNATHRAGPLVQNLQVTATHTSMPYDAFVYYMIAYRLSASGLGTWRPLDADALRHRYEGLAPFAWT